MNPGFDTPEDEEDARKAAERHRRLNNEARIDAAEDLHRDAAAEWGGNDQPHDSPV